MGFYLEHLDQPGSTFGKSHIKDSMNIQRKMHFLFGFALYKERSLTKRKQQETEEKAKRKRQKGALGRHHSKPVLVT